MPNYDCVLNLLSGQNYNANKLTYKRNEYINSLYSTTPYHSIIEKRDGDIDDIIYRDTFKISGYISDFCTLQYEHYINGTTPSPTAISTNNRYYEMELTALNGNQTISLLGVPNNEFVNNGSKDYITILSVDSSTAQRCLSLTSVAINNAYIRTPDHTLMHQFYFANCKKNIYSFEETEKLDTKMDEYAQFVVQANNACADLPCVYGDTLNQAGITFAIPIHQSSNALSELLIIPCCWSPRQSDFIIKYPDDKDKFVFTDIISNRSQIKTFSKDGATASLLCDFDIDNNILLCKYVYYNAKFTDFFDKATIDDIYNFSQTSDSTALANMFAIQPYYGTKTSECYCILYKYTFNPFEYCKISPIKTARYFNGSFMDAEQYIHDIPYIYQNLNNDFTTHNLDKLPAGSNYMDFDANVGIYQFGRLADSEIDDTCIQKNFVYAADDLLWGFAIKPPKIGTNIIVNFRLGNFTIRGDYKSRYELADWLDYGEGTAFFNSKSSVFDAHPCFKTSGLINCNIYNACDIWDSDFKNECISIHYNKDSICYYVLFNLSGMNRINLISDDIYKILLSPQNNYFSLLFTCNASGRTWACINHLLPDNSFTNTYIDGTPRIIGYFNKLNVLKKASCFDRDIHIFDGAGNEFCKGTLFCATNHSKFTNG